MRNSCIILVGVSEGGIIILKQTLKN